MRLLICCLLGIALLWLGAVHSLAARTLVINANTSDPAPRAAWEGAVAQFRSENPGLEVKLNIFDHESYKQALRNWLTSAPPDVVMWFVGQRMRDLVSLGLLEDVSELFTPEVKASFHGAAVDYVSVGGQQYGVPFTQYHWGVYLRRDILGRAGLREAPRDWTEFLRACEKLRAGGVHPIAIGSKDLWPTAGWFDYLNLRVNGYAFHASLLNGEVPYTDARVRAVFDKWRELLDRDCFMQGHAAMSWQESQALLYQGRAAMMLMGNFIVANFPPEVRDQMDFARFPTIDPGIGRYENAPMNSLHVPARATNKEDAKRFLAFVLRPDVQEEINRRTLQIPTNLKAAVADDRFLKMGRDLLHGADGLAQFFDRDTSEALARVAMRGFQEFMLRPDRLDDILQRIEQERRRIYQP
jgi:multiple sugar transport system substrate-binding protein